MRATTVAAIAVALCSGSAGLAATAVAADIAQRPAPVVKAKPSNHDLWLRVGRCERPGRGYGGVEWTNRGPYYEGGLGFARSSWDYYKPKGYPDNAGDATWRQQMVVANRLWSRAGWGWGCRG